MGRDKTIGAGHTAAKHTPPGERLRQKGEQLMHRKEELQRGVERVREDAQNVVESTKAAAADLASILREHLTEHPFLVLGGAFAVGWLFGALVPGWLVRFGFGVAKQAAVLAPTQHLVARTLV